MTINDKYIYTDEHKLYDKLTETCLINLFSVGKSTGTICLDNFDRKNKKHLLMAEISGILKNITNYQIFIKPNNYFNYLIFLIKNKHLRGIIKYSKRTTELVKIEEMMNYIAEAYDIKDDKIWEKIYDLNFNRKELHK